MRVISFKCVSKLVLLAFVRKLIRFREQPERVLQNLYDEMQLQFVDPCSKDVARFPVIAKNYTEIDMEVDPRLPVYRLTAPDSVLCEQSSNKHKEELIAAFKFPDIHPDQLQKLKQLILEYSDVWDVVRLQNPYSLNLLFAT